MQKTSAVVPNGRRGKVAPLPPKDEETGGKNEPPAAAEGADDAKVWYCCTKKWANISAVIVAVVLVLSLVIGLSVKLTYTAPELEAYPHRNSSLTYNYSNSTSVQPTIVHPTGCSTFYCEQDSDCFSGHCRLGG